jgi:HD-like signal output (HDOD) protein
MTVDKQRILHACRHNLPIIITSYKLPRETEMAIEETLVVFLEELGQSELKDHLIYCLRELTVNAKKANTKRIYFKEKGLDINDPGAYEKGMRHFKQETLDNIDYYLKKQQQEKLHIKVIFHMQANTLFLSVRNNVPIMERELNRVYDRIARSRAFSTMEEAFSEVMDDSEGAGLGIVIMILMLRKLGLTEKAYDLSLDKDETVSTLTIPINQLKKEKMHMLTDEIVNLIESLPPFPENISQLQRLLRDPDSEIPDITKWIEKDPGLAADLIKYVNSAAVAPGKKITSILEGVKIIGLNGLELVLYPYGAQKVLNKYIMKQKDMWRFSNKVAIYSRYLAGVFGLESDQQNDVYIAGLLGDLGKIILSLVHPDLSERIMDFCKSRNIPMKIFEELSAGTNHNEIGARIATKWNFPENLVELIQYNSIPHFASPNLQPLALTINLANNFATLEESLIDFSQFHPMGLQQFGIFSEDDLEELHVKLKNHFQEVFDG